MEFDIADYKKRTGRLVWDDLDLGQFSTAPLPEASLRCLRYMHDVEFHTVCYLRDLLLSPAHSRSDGHGLLVLLGGTRSTGTVRPSPPFSAPTGRPPARRGSPLYAAAWVGRTGSALCS